MKLFEYVSILFLFVSACSTTQESPDIPLSPTQIDVSATNTREPTKTPTPLPTFTQTPTYTIAPTNTPIPTTELPQSPTPTLTMGEFSISIAANRGWINTGIMIGSGQSLKITALGYAKGDANSSSNPNGRLWQNRGCDKAYVESFVGQKFSLDCLLTGAPWGALVGRIGSGKTFIVGTLQELLAPYSGDLYLGFNDCCSIDDNQGQYSVTVIIQ